MNSLVNTTILALLMIISHSHSKAQELTNEQDVFLKFLSISMSDEKIKKLVYPAFENYNPKYTKKDVYILNDNLSFFNEDNHRVTYNRIPYYFFSDEGLFFYGISCYLIIDECIINKTDGTMKFSLISCHKSESQSKATFKFEFLLKKGKWRIATKESFM